jgi:hypothetical protein
VVPTAIGGALPLREANKLTFQAGEPTKPKVSRVAEQFFT